MKARRALILGLVLVAVMGGLLTWTNRSVTPKPATLEDVHAEANRGGYRLLNTKELWQLVQQQPAGLLLVDTRQDWEYRAGHIQGAVNFPMEPTWWARWRKAGAMEALLGPDKDRTVVFY